MKVYFSKGPDDGWFVKGSICELLADCDTFGIFSGLRESQMPGEWAPLNLVYEDEEGCSFDEFWIFDIEEQENK